MSDWGWKPYVSVAERRKKAEKAAAKAKKAGAELSPIVSYRGAIAKTFWGKAWCDNLERYSDYANRLPRGRTYVRNGSVIDLKIAAGEVRAQVMGSSLYEVAVTVATVPATQWQAIGADCSGSIDSLVELLQGKLSQAVMARICKPGTGLFPAPKEIAFRCSCPDWASMCKHVAAVLYGVGARLDQQPELLFSLRRVDAKDLVTDAGASLPKSRKRPSTAKVLDDAQLADLANVFGIEMAELSPSPPSPKPTASRKKPAATKAPAKKAAKKAVAKTAPAKPSAEPRKSAAGKSATSKAKAASSPAKAKGASAKPKAATTTAKRASTQPAKTKSR